MNCESQIVDVIKREIILDMIYILEIYDDIVQTMINSNYEIDGKYNKKDLHLFYTFCCIGRNYDMVRDLSIHNFINIFFEYYNREYDNIFCIDFFYGVRQINKKSIHIPTPTTVNRDIEKIKANIQYYLALMTRYFF
jgi:hypothetical protein